MTHTDTISPNQKYQILEYDKDGYTFLRPSQRGQYLSLFRAVARLLYLRLYGTNPHGYRLVNASSRASWRRAAGFDN